MSDTITAPFIITPFFQTTGEVSYQPAKPDAMCSDPGDALLSGSPPALWHEGEAAGEESAALCADAPVTPLQGKAGEGGRGDMWGKCLSLGHGNVKAERRVEDLGGIFLYSPFTPLFSL